MSRQTPDELFPPKRRLTGLKSPSPTQPPQPPSKSTSPRSRIFSRVSTPKPFYLHHSLTSSPSPHYNPNNEGSYLEQCFETIEELGKGSFGIVYKVRSKDDEKLYAVKKSVRRLTTGANRRRCLDEVKRGRAVGDSPYCLQYFDAWEENDLLYIQLELCSRGNLKDYSLEHDLSEKELWRILFNVAMGLKHIHEKGFLHLDIKPANIFMTNDYTVKIGDFGMLQRFKKTERHGSLPDDEFEDGDPVYIAPELLGQEGCGPPSDVFSVGMTMLDLVSDRELPGYGAGWHELRKGNVPREMFRDMSEAFVDIVLAMIQEDPRNRPTLDEILNHPRVWPFYLRYQVWACLKWTVGMMWWCLLRLLQFFNLFPKQPAQKQQQQKTPYKPLSNQGQTTDAVLSTGAKKMVPLKIDFASDNEIWDDHSGSNVVPAPPPDPVDPGFLRTQSKLLFDSEEEMDRLHSDSLRRRLWGDAASTLSDEDE